MTMCHKTARLSEYISLNPIHHIRQFLREAALLVPCDSNQYWWCLFLTTNCNATTWIEPVLKNFNNCRAIKCIRLLILLHGARLLSTACFHFVSCSKISVHFTPPLHQFSEWSQAQNSMRHYKLISNVAAIKSNGPFLWIKLHAL